MLKIAGVPESSYAGGDHSASVATFRLRFEKLGYIPEKTKHGSARSFVNPE